ncbi:MAG: YidC/Oxa1 family membrane protein insertase, partial [Bacteroidia bacterium]
MDKNSAIGLTLILVIFIGFQAYMGPSAEEKAEVHRLQDSIATAETEAQRLNEPAIDEAVAQFNDTPSQPVTANPVEDSLAQVKLKSQFGDFGNAAVGEGGTVVIENEVLAITLSKKGGHPLSVQLKAYQTHDSLPLMLFDGDENRFSLEFFSKNNRIVTQDLYFQPSAAGFSISGENSKTLSMRLPAGPNQYLEYVYTLTGNSYMVDFDINMVGLDNVIERNTRSLDLHWRNDLPSQEKSLDNERMNSTIYYRFSDEDVDYISETSDDKEEVQADLQWVAFKQQFFSSVLISKDVFEPATSIETSRVEENVDVVKTCDAKLTIPYTGQESEQIALQFYFGPNHYNSLKEYKLGLEEMIPLGWGIFGYVNKLAVIPLFDLLKDTGLGYGIIIL